MENKGIATEHKSGIFGHLVRKYDEYIEAYYLEKYNSTRKKVFYKKIMKKVLVNPKTIFCPLVLIEDDSSMTIEEYQLFLIV